MTVNTDLPVDIETMRASAGRLLAPDAAVPSAQDLETLTQTLTGHLALIIPEVELAAAGRRGDADIPRACARWAVLESRRKMSVEPGSGLSAHVAHARRLSRSLNALCDHHEILRDRHPGAGQ